MTTDVFGPAKLGPLTLRNRIIKAATFEGMSYKGKVTEALVDFHRTTAAGGVGMTTIAYCAVSPGGRGAPNELVPRPELVPELRRIVEAVHGEGAAINAQIGHAGPIGNARVTGSRAVAASTGFSPLGTRYHAMSESEIEAAIAEAKTAVEGGDPDAMTEKTNALAQAAMKLGEAMYKAQQAETEGAAGPAAGPTAPEGEAEGAAGNDEDVVDAEFSEVDEENKS
jgi:hypothetical protein